MFNKNNNIQIKNINKSVINHIGHNTNNFKVSWKNILSIIILIVLLVLLGLFLFGVIDKQTFLSIINSINFK